MSRATLKPVISKLRDTIIKSIAGKMEKFGFDINGNVIINKPLSEYDSVIRNNLISLFESRRIAGNKKEYIAYVQDSARTFLHILICFKTMEKRGLISKVLEGLLDSRVYDQILPDFNSISPIAFTDLAQRYNEAIIAMEKKDNEEEDIEYYQFLFMLSELSKEMAREVPLLFKDYEHNLVHPDFSGVKEILFLINKIDNEEYFEDDFLGWIYQYWVDIKEDELREAKENKEVSYADNIFYEILSNLEEEQTQFGEYYTPRWVVKYIIDNTLRPYFKENRSIKTIKLLDPACGAGNFLVYAFDVFYELYKIEHPEWSDSTIINFILEKNIFGVDIQREPLQITALNLWFKAKTKALDVKIKNLNLFNMNILKANSLYRWENDEEEFVQISFFDIEIDFTEKQYKSEDIGKYISAQKRIAKRDARLFFKNRFNIIVMNPPYSGLRKLDEDTAKFLKDYYPRNYHNLFEAFVERATELICKRGYIGFISSDSFLTLESHTNLRTMILDKTYIHMIVNLGAGVFEGPAVKSAILIFSDEKNYKKLSWAMNALKWKNSQYIDKYLDSEIKYSFLQSEFKKIALYPFLYDVSNNLIQKLITIKPFGDYVEIKQGMITGDNARFLKLKWEIPNDQLNQNWYKYAKGGGYSKFANNIFDYIYWANDGKEIKAFAKKKYGSETRTIKNQSYFFREGITYSDITSENVFSGRYLPPDCIFDVKGSCIFSDTINNLYLLGFINSKFVNYILKKFNPSPSFQVCDMLRVPYKVPDRESEQLIINITGKAKEIKEFLLGFNYLSDFYHEVELVYGFNNGARTVNEGYEIFTNKYYELEDELNNIQQEIDQVVYKIYEVGEQDIKTIEEEFPHIAQKPNKDYDIKKVVLNYIRAVAKDVLIAGSPKLYLDTELETLIKLQIEKAFENGYGIVEEIEAILEKPIIDIIRSGAKIGSSNITLAGKGSKDLEEPLLQQKVLAGSGANKQVIIWHLTHFLLEFEEDKKYVMQNEIRRLGNDIFKPRLQVVKSKLQNSTSSSERKELEKQEKILTDCVKAIESWKVIN